MSDEKITIGLVMGFLAIASGVIAGYSFVKAKNEVEYERSLKKHCSVYRSALGTGTTHKH